MSVDRLAQTTPTGCAAPPTWPTRRSTPRVAGRSEQANFQAILAVQRPVHRRLVPERVDRPERARTDLDRRSRPGERRQLPTATRSTRPDLLRDHRPQPVQLRQAAVSPTRPAPRKPIVEYTWGKIWNAKAYQRLFQHAAGRPGILNESQVPPHHGPAAGPRSPREPVKLERREFLQVLAASAVAGLGLTRHAQADAATAEEAMYDLPRFARCRSCMTDCRRSCAHPFPRGQRQPGRGADARAAAPPGGRAAAQSRRPARGQRGGACADLPGLRGGGASLRQRSGALRTWQRWCAGSNLTPGALLLDGVTPGRIGHRALDAWPGHGRCLQAAGRRPDDRALRNSRSEWSASRRSSKGTSPARSTSSHRT